MIEGFEAHLRPATSIFDADLRVEHVVRDELGIVDLQEEAGVHNRPVLLMHRIGDGEQVFLVTGDLPDSRICLPSSDGRVFETPQTCTTT